MSNGEDTTPAGQGADSPAGQQDLVAEMHALRQRTRAQRHAYWFPLVLFGVLTCASIPFYWQPPPTNANGVLVTTGGPSWIQQPFFAGAPGLVQGYVAYYWVVALLAGLLLTQLWYRWHARRVGLLTPARGYVVTTAVITGLAVALPPLSRLRGPHWLSFLHRLDLLWPWALTIRGTFPLLIIAAGLAVLAVAERSRALAIITGLYTCTALLGIFYDVSNVVYRLGWTMPAPAESLPNVVLPGLVLLIAGGGACVARLHRRALA